MLGIDIACFVIIGLMFWVFPKGVKFMLAAPLVGIAGGGFTWSIAAMFCFSLINLHIFAGFLVGGIVLAEGVAFATD